MAARALTLGRGHRSIDLLADARANEDLAAAEEARRILVGHLSLIGQCAIYGIEHRFAAAKDLLQRSFLVNRQTNPSQACRSSMPKQMPKRRCAFISRSSAT